MSIGNGEIGKSRAGAQVVEQLENNLVFTSQSVFSVSKRFLIGALATVDIVVDGMALNSPERFFIFLPLRVKGFGGGPVEIDFYAGTDSNDDGTLWQGFNRNNESSNIAQASMRLNPTINNVGVKQEPEFEIQSAATGPGGITSIGGESTQTLVTNLRKDIKYMLRFANTSSDIVRCVIAANWFEL